MTKINSFVFLLLIILFSFKQGDGGVQEETKVLLSTTYGNIIIKLYNETPKHRDNFIKLVNGHFYDSLLFHRVIQNFMIQGGDPDSKNALPGVVLGDGDLNYAIPAEFNPNLFHKRGVIAGARNDDFENPSQSSSACQFYIVQGRIFTDSLLSIQEKRITRQKAFNNVINKEENQTLRKKYLSFQKENLMDSIKILKKELDLLTETELKTTPSYAFSSEQRKAYKAIGGAAHLDGSYTVFGEVIEGMDVVDKIAAVPVDKVARPLNNIRMTMSILSKK